MAKTSNSITREECSSINKKVMEKIDELSSKVEGIAINLAALPGDLVEKLDKRYADKKTERTVDKILWLVVSAVILAGLAIIIR